MPGTSMSLHYWQPAPGWRLLPCLANPGNPAVSPMWKMKEQALTTLINQQCKKMREGKTSNNSYCHTLKQWPMPNKKWEAQHSFIPMPSIVITIKIQFLFLAINMFWVLLRAHFNPLLGARAKMILSGAHENIFYAHKHKPFCFINLMFCIVSCTCSFSENHLFSVSSQLLVGIIFTRG